MSPHFHPSFERVEVKEGTLLVGVGDGFDVKKTLPLAVGDTLTAPAGLHHYSIAKGRTVVSVRFVGPYTITYVHAHEAPRQGSFPFGYSRHRIGRQVTRRVRKERVGGNDTLTSWRP
jgi:hypothetical protein